MQKHTHTFADLWRAGVVGLAGAIGTAAVMLVLTQLGVSPFPQPLAHAFASTLLGTMVPLPVGLLFHVAYATLWGSAYVYLFRRQLTFTNAALLSAALWILVLVGFFPYVGWGFFGLAIGPQLIAGAFVTHALFAVLVWLTARYLFPARQSQSAPSAEAKASAPADMPR